MSLQERASFYQKLHTGVKSELTLEQILAAMPSAYLKKWFWHCRRAFNIEQEILGLIYLVRD